MRVIKDKKLNGGNKRKPRGLLTYVALFMATLFLCSEVLAFESSKGIKAATDPLLSLLQSYWGIIILLAGVAAFLIGEGDLSIKNIRKKATAVLGTPQSNQSTNKKENK